MKKFVKTKIRNAAFKYLLTEKETKSKIKGILYKKFALQKYATSSLFSNYEVQILSKLRYRNIEVKSNFKTKYTINNITNLQCSIDNCFEIEDQKHILRCKPVLQRVSKKLIFNISKVQYYFIFSNTKNYGGNGPIT